MQAQAERQLSLPSLIEDLRRDQLLNDEDHQLALSRAKMAPAERCDQCTQRHEKACSVACADRSRARSERLVGRRARALVDPEGSDADGRKERAKGLT